MAKKAKVGDYMTTDVVTISPENTVEEVVNIIRQTKHDGFPVLRDGKVQGYISSYDLLLCNPKDKVSNVMSTDLLVAHPNIDLMDSARVIFRSGLSKLPVVNDEGKMVGIITNSDVIRSQIERANPRKALRLIKVLEVIHGIELYLKRGVVNVNSLIPTQSIIYADELEGRIYELEKNLAEPLIVIQMPTRNILVDGHHRVIAARRLGIGSMEAYLIVIQEEIELGMEKTAKKSGLRTLDDIEILDHIHHPLVEITTRGSEWI